MDIDKILLKALNNKTDSEEYQALEAWKAESEENLKLLQDLAGNKASAPTAYKSYDKQSAWEKVNAQLPEQVTVTHPKPSRWLWLTVAVAAVAALVYFGISRSGNTTEEVKMYQSEQSSMEVILADASNVWLREGGSTINLLSDFNTERRVKLAGEAFFDIAKDPNRPFIIEVQNGDFIKVLGTSFNVVNTDQAFDLTVYSGVVEFHTLNRVLTLEKGDNVTKVNGSFAVTKNNDTNKISWKTKQLVFEGSGLNVIFDAIEDMYGVTIQHGNSDISNCRTRTKFDNETVKSIMSELGQQHGFTYTITDKTISVKGLQCN